MLFQIQELGHVVIDNIWLVGMIDQVVLMIALSFVEGVKRGHLCRNLTAKNFCLIQLLDVAFGNSLLFVSRKEDRRTILWANVRTLSVQLGRVVCNSKENLEELSVSDLRRVVDNAHGFSMTSSP